MTAEEYKLKEVPADGLVILSHPRYPDTMFTKGKCKKHMKCCITGEDLYKKEAWIAVTNGYNRSHRIKGEIIDKLIANPNH